MDKVTFKRGCENAVIYMGLSTNEMARNATRWAKVAKRWFKIGPRGARSTQDAARWPQNGQS